LIKALREILGHDRQEVQGIDADWLADNFHIVDDVLREVRQDLPRGYDVVLPKLGIPPLSGFPRVYALAVTLIAHTDSELDEPKITRFVKAFQEVVPLTIGELWALPTMFRLVLLENLRRLSEQMLRRWEERQRAERWFKQAMAVAESAGRASRSSACTLERAKRSLRRSPGAIAARSGTGGRPRAAPARSRADCAW